jgi:hypothetical protein
MLLSLDIVGNLEDFKVLKKNKIITKLEKSGGKSHPMLRRT